MSLFLTLPLLAQVGAAPPLPHEQYNGPLRPPRSKTKQAEPVQPQPVTLPPCPQTDDADNDAEAATTWLAKAKGPERAKANECLGMALSRSNEWSDAADAFRAAQADANTPQWRARLGAAAGEAALNDNDPTAALAALDAAAPDASSEPTVAGGIALMRARALVALKRDAEAEAPLAQAREASPKDAEVWLLSATLSRRLNKLGEAQGQIEKAVELLPTDPEIGLEAGLIAALSGRDEAARKSWQSVVTAAPDSAPAATAKTYLAQLDQMPKPAPTPAKKQAKP